MHLETSLHAPQDISSCTSSHLSMHIETSRGIIIVSSGTSRHLFIHLEASLQASRVIASDTSRHLVRDLESSLHVSRGISSSISRHLFRHLEASRGLLTEQKLLQPLLARDIERRKHTEITCLNTWNEWANLHYPHSRTHANRRGFELPLPLVLFTHKTNHIQKYRFLLEIFIAHIQIILEEYLLHRENDLMNLKMLALRTTDQNKSPLISLRCNLRSRRVWSFIFLVNM